MITQKQFSGVFFGTAKRLDAVLQELQASGAIEDYAYISHEPESAEKKAHLHFWGSPLRRLDTAKLRKSLDSIEGGALPIVKSKFSDWLLYALHDPHYLAYHGLTKNKHYLLHEVVGTFTQAQLAHLKEQAIDEVFPRWNILDYVKNAVEENVPWSEIITSGIIPPNQFLFYSEVYKTLCAEKTQIKQNKKTQKKETKKWN